MSLLLSQGVGDGHDSLGEAASAVALRTEGGFSPQDERTQRSLRVVVGGFDAGFMNERPHSIAVIEDVLARAANAANAKAHPRL